MKFHSGGQGFWVIPASFVWTCYVRHCALFFGVIRDRITDTHGGN